MKKKKEEKDGFIFENFEFVNNSERKYITHQLKLITKTLKELRVNVGFSQEELAEMIAVSLPTIKSIEQNVRLPSLPMLLKILYFLDHQSKEKSRDCLI